MKLPLSYAATMTTITIGYARCSTDKQDLAAQKAALEKLCRATPKIQTSHKSAAPGRPWDRQR